MLGAHAQQWKDTNSFSRKNLSKHPTDVKLWQLFFLLNRYIICRVYAGGGGVTIVAYYYCKTLWHLRRAIQNRRGGIGLQEMAWKTLFQSDEELQQTSQLHSNHLRQYFMQRTLFSL